MGRGKRHDTTMQNGGGRREGDNDAFDDGLVSGDSSTMTEGGGGRRSKQSKQRSREMSGRRPKSRGQNPRETETSKQVTVAQIQSSGYFALGPEYQTILAEEAHSPYFARLMYRRSVGSPMGSSLKRKRRAQMAGVPLPEVARVRGPPMSPMKTTAGRPLERDQRPESGGRSNGNDAEMSDAERVLRMAERAELEHEHHRLSVQEQGKQAPAEPLLATVQLFSKLTNHRRRRIGTSKVPREMNLMELRRMIDHFFPYLTEVENGFVFVDDREMFIEKALESEIPLKTAPQEPGGVFSISISCLEEDLMAEQAASAPSDAPETEQIATGLQAAAAAHEAAKDKGGEDAMNFIHTPQYATFPHLSEMASQDHTVSEVDSMLRHVGPLKQRVPPPKKEVAVYLRIDDADVDDIAWAMGLNPATATDFDRRSLDKVYDALYSRLPRLPAHIQREMQVFTKWITRKWRKLEKQKNPNKALTELNLQAVVEFMDPFDFGIELEQLRQAFEMVLSMDREQFMNKDQVKAFKRIQRKMRRSSYTGGKTLGEFTHFLVGTAEVMQREDLRQELVNAGCRADDVDLVLRGVKSKRHDHIAPRDVDQLIHRVGYEFRQRASQRASKKTGKLQRYENILQSSERALKQKYSLSGPTAEELDAIAAQVDLHHNGKIGFEDVEEAFRLLHRSDAVMQSMLFGRTVMTRIKKLLELRELSVNSWFRLMKPPQSAHGLHKTADVDVVNVQDFRRGLRLLCDPNDDGTKDQRRKGPRRMSLSTASAATSVGAERSPGSSATSSLGGIREEDENDQEQDNYDEDEDGSGSAKNDEEETNPGEEENDSASELQLAEDGNIAEGKSASKDAEEDDMSKSDVSYTGTEDSDANAMEDSDARPVEDRELVRPFTEKEIAAAVRFIDESGESDLDIGEMKTALEKLSRPPQLLSPEAKSGLYKVEELLSRKGLRLLDLFQHMDPEGRGFVRPHMLIKVLAALDDRAARLEAVKRRQEAVKEQIQTEKEFAARERKELKERRARAESSGAAFVMRQLHARIRDRGLKLSDIFSELDTSGDGIIQQDELMEGLRRMALPAKTVQRTLARRAEQNLREAVEMMSEQTQHHMLRDYMRDMEESGAALLFYRLETFMRRNAMSLADVFQAYWQFRQQQDLLEQQQRDMQMRRSMYKPLPQQTTARSTTHMTPALVDGTALTPASMREVLVFHRIKFTDEEFQGLVDCVDRNKRGAFAVKDFRQAMRQWKRFLWDAGMQHKDADSSLQVLLYLRFPSFRHMFSSLDPIHHTVSYNELKRGFARLRGVADALDPFSMGNVPFYPLSEETLLQTTIQIIADHLCAPGKDLQRAIRAACDVTIDVESEEHKAKAALLATSFASTTKSLATTSGSVSGASSLASGGDGRNGAATPSSLLRGSTRGSMSSVAGADTVDDDERTATSGPAWVSRVLRNFDAQESGRIVTENLKVGMNTRTVRRWLSNMKFMESFAITEEESKLLHSANDVLTDAEWDKVQQFLDSDNSGLTLTDAEAALRLVRKVGSQETLTEEVLQAFTRASKALRASVELGLGPFVHQLVGEKRDFVYKTHLEYEMRRAKVNQQDLDIVLTQIETDPADRIRPSDVDRFVRYANLALRDKMTILSTKRTMKRFDQMVNAHQHSRGEVTEPPSPEQIHAVLEYMDPTNSGRIPYEHLEETLRLPRRSPELAQLVHEGEAVMRRVRGALQSSGMSRRDWFEHMGFTHYVPVTERVSRGVLEHGLAALAERSSETFDQRDALSILRFANDVSDNDISLFELSRAFQKLDRKAELTEQAWIGILKIDALMQKRNVMLNQLFCELDTFNRRSVPTESLHKKILYWAAVPLHLMEVTAQRRQMMSEMRESINKKWEDDVRTRALREEAEVCGAGEALRKLEREMDQRSMRLKDVWDAPRDAKRTIAELRQSIRDKAQPSTSAAMSLKIREEKQRRREQDREQKEAEWKVWEERMRECEEHRVSVVLDGLEACIRRGALKIMNLFEQLDEEGTGLVKPKSLQRSLRKLGIDTTDEQIETLIRYLDRSGDGLVEWDELEEAMREWKRYKWHKSFAKRVHPLEARPLLNRQQVDMLMRFLTSNYSLEVVSADRILLTLASGAKDRRAEYVREGSGRSLQGTDAPTRSEVEGSRSPQSSSSSATSSSKPSGPSSSTNAGADAMATDVANGGQDEEEDDDYSDADEEEPEMKAASGNDTVARAASTTVNDDASDDEEAEDVYEDDTEDAEGDVANNEVLSPRQAPVDGPSDTMEADAGTNAAQTEAAAGDDNYEDDEEEEEDIVATDSKPQSEANRHEQDETKARQQQPIDTEHDDDQDEAVVARDSGGLQDDNAAAEEVDDN